ncbi:MAG: hypothetical protein PGN22_12190 [Agrobacterium cavarae]|uniref:Transmembrane protein n=1 Tax=Agrobacterium cavarae TaxID=2528239 RepID=A0ABY1YAE5_9HYPH|nr:MULTISPECIES: hypothetical protein [Rhizobium/Agrobacterium group]MDP9570201.1 hypothetical protein [Agrobacterium larrymoorei]TBN13414.1 hypothetical protein EYC79_09380 [Agrobacterium cavarae]
MTLPLGMYYRLREERQKKENEALLKHSRPRPRRESEGIMFLRLIAVTGGLLLAVSLIMQSVQ